MSTLKATWLRDRKTGVAREIYAISGSAKDIAEYIEYQGENARFLQPDGTIGVDVTNVPVFYSKKDKGKVATLRYAADIDMYILEMTYEEKRLRSIVREAYGLDAEETTGISPNPAVVNESNETTPEQEADMNGHTVPAKPAATRRVSMRNAQPAG